jgi:hypothetical protein
MNPILMIIMSTCPIYPFLLIYIDDNDVFVTLKSVKNYNVINYSKK